MLKYRITTENNSDATDFRLLDGIAETTRHNGGKTVICLVQECDERRADAILIASHKVRTFTTEPAL